jgi:hypothetical protein
MTDFYYYEPRNALNPAVYKNPLVNPYEGLFNFDLGMNKPISYQKEELPEMEYTDNILDELMKKPHFFKDINDRNADIKMTSANDYSILIPTDDTIIINESDGNDDLSKGNQEFLKKKKFYDIFTDLFNKELLEEDQNKIHKFQYIVINSFQKAIESYRRRYNLKKTDLFFHYKGGTTMKIVFKKYEKIFLNRSIPDIDRYFSRSDSDYQINLKTTTQNFNFHFYNLNIITYNLLNRLKIYFNDNYINIFNVNILDKNKMIEIINIANDVLFTNKDENEENIYNNIKQIIGCQILDRFYYNINGKENFIISNNPSNITPSNYKIFFTNIENNKSNITVSKEFNDDNNKNLNIKKNSFFITKENNIFGGYKTLLSNINEPRNYIYQYLNETNKFIDPTDANNLNHFNLHRIKLACVLLFETNNGKLGIFSTPSEIIDISFPKLNDHKLNKQIDYKYMIYSFDTEIGKLNYTGYTLEGFCYDLKLIIYSETASEPWKDGKYKKRLYRLLLFSLYIVYSIKTSNRRELIENLRDIFIKNVPLNDELKQNEYFESLYIDVQKVVYKPISPEKNTYYYNINEFFRIVLSNIPTDTLVQDGDIKFLQKYLKYKKKYLLLRKQMSSY